MSVDVPELRRVVFELPSEDIPDLMAILGDFATGRHMAITFSAAQGESPSLVEQSSEKSYNPQLVEWLTDSRTEQLVPVVTKANMKKAEELFKFASGNAERTFNIIRGQVRLGAIPGDYVHTANADERTLLGFRAERFGSMVAFAERVGITEWTNFGSHSVVFLKEIKENLLLS